MLLKVHLFGNFECDSGCVFLSACAHNQDRQTPLPQLLRSLPVHALNY